MREEDDDSKPKFPNVFQELPKFKMFSYNYFDLMFQSW